MGAPRLSALAVAHNEERNLGECLATVAFADEVVVVLDRCTDGSRDIAEAAGAILVEGAWDREGPRRHAGIETCSGDWILELDADERVPAELAAEIRARLPTAPPGHFLIGFDNYIGDRLVRHGWGAYNGVSAKACLFKKGFKTWGGQRVHPRLQFAGVRSELSGRIRHYVDADLAATFARLNRYSTLAALDALDAGEKPRLWPALRRIPSRFWKVYVGRRGYREGPWGLALGLFAALYPMLTYLKLATAKRG
ncbi:MAG: glycosyltransferase family 2 protein [Rhodospirillales bacterium]|nr:glycosyltransferase family 2 protein [Rhodospirillales bacterium]